MIPKDTPRFVKDNGNILDHVIAPGTIGTNSRPLILVIGEGDGRPDHQRLSDEKISSGDVDVNITPDMPFPVIIRRVLEGASRLPTTQGISKSTSRWASLPAKSD
jgi:hypothetical protein